MRRLAGPAAVMQAAGSAAAATVELPLLFADGFENGDPCWWGAVPAASGCPELGTPTACSGGQPGR